MRRKGCATDEEDVGDSVVGTAADAADAAVVDRVDDVDNVAADTVRIAKLIQLLVLVDGWMMMSLSLLLLLLNPARGHDTHVDACNA